MDGEIELFYREPTSYKPGILLGEDQKRLITALDDFPPQENHLTKTTIKQIGNIIDTKNI